MRKEQNKILQFLSPISIVALGNDYLHSPYVLYEKACTRDMHQIFKNLLVINICILGLNSPYVCRYNEVLEKCLEMKTYHEFLWRIPFSCSWVKKKSNSFWSNCLRSHDQDCCEQWWFLWVQSEWRMGLCVSLLLQFIVRKSKFCLPWCIF